MASARPFAPSIGSMTPCRILSLTQEEKERREDQIHQDHQKDGNHHGTCRGTPDLLGAGACRQPFVTSHRSEEHTSELQSRLHLVCRLLLEKKKNMKRKCSHNKA